MVNSALNLNKQGDNIHTPFLILNQSVFPCLFLFVDIKLKVLDFDDAETHSDGVHFADTLQ